MLIVYKNALNTLNDQLTKTVLLLNQRLSVFNKLSAFAKINFFSAFF